MNERLAAIHTLAKIPMKTDEETRRVDIVMLKFKEEPEVIDKAISRIVHNTSWPFKLTVYDNRPNTANTSRIWNKLILESKCDYICVIDSDAFVPVRSGICWLTRMMESIDYTGLVVPMGDNVGGTNKATGPEPYPSFEKQKGIWSGFCFLIKKSAFMKSGMFDTDFYIYGQDSEFAHRCMRKLGGAIYRKDVFVQHLGSYSFKKADAEGDVDREADKQYAASLYRLKTTGKLS